MQGCLSLILPVKITQATLVTYSGVFTCLCCESLKILEVQDQQWNVSRRMGEAQRGFVLSYVSISPSLATNTHGMLGQGQQC